MVMAAEPKVKTSTRLAPASEPSQVIDKKSEIVRVYMDTLYTTTTTKTKTEVVQEEDTAFTRKGHYIQALIGAGYGSMGHSLSDPTGMLDGKNKGGLNALAQFNYVYYFHENWGFMVGLEAQRFASNTVLNGRKLFAGYHGDTDDSEQYEHIVKMNNWKEKEVAYMLGLPIGIQMQFPIAKMKNVSHRNNQLRLYADLGVKVNYLISQKYNLVSGSIEHMGYYAHRGLELSGIEDRDYYTETIGAVDANGNPSRFQSDKKNLNLSSISADGMFDLGLMIPVQEHLDLMVGIYANYTFNDLRSGTPKEIGWREDDNVVTATGVAGVSHPYMETYDGVIATDYVNAVRPWAVGIKFGISWNTPAKKPKKYNTDIETKTTFELQPREEVENVPLAARKINDIMKKSVIWFNFDSDKPKLQPADVVDKIAEVLLEHPEQMVLVYGHASKEGSLEYNQRLSERRAASIVRLLKKKGVPEKQIVSKGFSYTQQYDDSENPYHNIALDRRVEIIPVFEKDRLNE